MDRGDNQAVWDAVCEKQLNRSTETFLSGLRHSLSRPIIERRLHIMHSLLEPAFAAKLFHQLQRAAH